MFLGSYRLFDIVEQNEEAQFEICVITLDIKEPLNHSLTLNYLPIEDKTIETCKEHNDEQVSSINQSIEEVRGYLSANPDSTKRMSQLEYLSNTLDHYFNWYKDKKLHIPDKPPSLELTKGSFSANKNFSIIKIKNKSYSLRRNQPKIVELLFQNLKSELDGLSYPELARKLDLTNNYNSKLSNYFKDSPRVRDVFNHSKRTGKYSLKH
jgi:hypothetical protein